MELGVRVILVGRTGLDARLRLDPAVEMIRVKSALEAIGELSDPIDEHSPKAAVVIVGPDATPEPGGAANGDGTSEEFVRGLRLVDPEVRVLRSVTNGHAEAAGSPTAPFDGVVNADASAEVLRTLVHRRPGGPVPASHQSAPPPPPLGAEPKPARGSETVEEAREEPPVSRGQDGPDDLGDGALVRVALRGGDIVSAALELARARLGDPHVNFEASPPGAPAREDGVPVIFEGAVVGHLFSAQTPGAALEAHARWLASWVRLGEQQAQLREAAFTDPLTGAWNRRYFGEFLGAAIERARTARQSITVLIFDIDDFKQFNDLYGHAAADEILTETVRLLRSVIRPSDRVCRIGGDEFAVIFHEPGGPRVPGSHPPESVFEIATRFQEQIRQQRFPKLGLDAPGRLTISGGLATFPWDGMTPDALVRSADARALESKRRGKNAIAFGPGDQPAPDH